MNVLPLPAPTGGPAAASDTTLGDGTSDVMAGFVAALADALAAVSSEIAPVPAGPAEELAAATDARVTPDTPAADHRSTTAAAVLGVIADWRTAGRPETLGELVRATVDRDAIVPAEAVPADPEPVDPEPVTAVETAAPLAAPTAPVAHVPAVPADAPTPMPVGPPSADPVPVASTAPVSEVAPVAGPAPAAAVEATGFESIPERPRATMADATDAPEPRLDPAVTIDPPVAAAPRSERADRPLPSAAAERVLRAIEVLQHAPPPRRLSFDVDGVRITVALQADSVAVDLRGPGGPVPASWRSDLGATLAAHGFDLASGNPDHQSRPRPDDAPPAPRPSTPRPAPARADHGLRL